MGEGDERAECGNGAYTPRFEDVLAAEWKYLELRRKLYGLPATSVGDGASGLALSGGGIRSATFCLGVLQALMRGRVFRKFDYLSTVSGGGYIGGCLSSLLTNQAEPGVDKDNSPFVGLRENDDYASPDKTRLSVRHQMHHLRTHGQYLAPRAEWFSRDVQRLVGSVISGMSYTLLMFALVFVAAVALTHLALSAVDRDLNILSPGTSLLMSTPEGQGYAGYLKAVVSAWYDQRFAPPLFEAVRSAREQLGSILLVAAMGAAWCLTWVVVFTVWSTKRVQEPKEQRTWAGWSAEDQRESWLVWSFNWASVVVALGLMLGLSMNIRNRLQTSDFLGALLIPAAFAVGGAIISHLVTFVAETAFAKLAWLPGFAFLENRARRSRYASIRGGSLYGLAAACLLPPTVVLLFSIANLPMKFFVSLAALVGAHYATRDSSRTALPTLGASRRLLANLAVGVFLVFGFAEISARLLTFYRAQEPVDIVASSSLIAMAGTAAVLILGFLIDANRTSPHYFYRDRLTEAYLKTDARTRRTQATEQGMPLTVLRDDEDLKLSELGDGRGPYHLIVTALNLHGSPELNRKSFLSEHFIFSREYVGSEVTGWVRTTAYRDNTTRLARTLTISAAAVASAMGYHTFGAQSFMTTLTNARLGYWMENPWFYRGNSKVRAGPAGPFWPRYLAFEVFGLYSARRKFINLSDGGHTGDNLGLMPLLQRRCSTIVICDAEADPGYSFSSFNNAVRMAYIEMNITIDIDLTPIMQRTTSDAGFPVSKASIAEGTIQYLPPLPGGPGRLVYIKTSVSGTGLEIPVHVANYLKSHGTFPHETTADQFFDDAQFEAYRALGDRLGSLAAGVL